MESNRLWALFWTVVGFVAVVAIAALAYSHLEWGKRQAEIARARAAAVCRCHDHCQRDDPIPDR